MLMNCQINPDRERRRQPIGVAMNKLSRHGKLIFSSYPILLPEEDFISVAELEN
jgi:predicted component of type VI protein secretion system